MITLKVSRIQRTWLRRVVLVLSLPFVLLITALQAVCFGLIVMLCEPLRRAIEVCSVMAGAWPTFREQWRPAPETSQGEQSHD